MTDSSGWTLDPDRAFSAIPAERELARQIYAASRALPIISMHGHVDAGLLLRNQPFGDPAELLVVPDHYVVRLLVSQGATPAQLGVTRRDGGPSETDPRQIWRRFCAGWKYLRGTPSRYWLEHELAEVFGLSGPPSTATADRLYDELSAVLAQPGYLPRALFERFGIEILATTDDAASPLSDHAALAQEGWGERVIPTFRPDRYTRLERPGWKAGLADLEAAADVAVDSLDGFLEALRRRRMAFAAAGARASDHGHRSALAAPLERAEAERLFAAGLAGQINPAQAEAFAGHLLFEMARMSLEDGLVMQLHPGVLRDYDPAAHATYGPDAGFDIPLAAEFTRSLRPLLEAFGRHPGFRLILFTVDEDTYSRELAPLAGVFPAVRLGAPWWFLDTPGGMLRFRESVTDSAGFYNTAGFVDDTRAFASIPARHDLARRIDARHLARLVAEGYLNLDEAQETAVDLAYHLPRQAYARLDRV
ncbi:MAG: glucuronate isomerase [Propionibacteriaceae bacterium]|jgi:glucuronate isomerase|nr:glucuronate isomerase [Propionibacteriaceae bacterium]